MTTVAVAILDRDDWQANTDIIVVVDTRRRTLTWIPRDLWSPRHADRINRAFAIGGGPALLDSLRELGFPCRGLICLRRRASEKLLEDVRVSVPVGERLEFWYPLHPTRPIEEGRKQIAFLPPAEELSGERLHQWIGARLMVGRAGSDLYRLARQQTLLRAMLAAGIDFARAAADPELVSIAGTDPRPQLAAVRADWTMATFDAVKDATIDGKAVLLPVGERRSAWRRLRDAVRGRSRTRSAT